MTVETDSSASSPEERLPEKAPASSADPVEEASKFYRDRYRVFIEDIAEGVYETDLEGRFTFFNHALCRIFGVPFDQLHNRSYRDFMEPDHAREAYERFHEVFRTGRRMTDIIWPFTRPDGRKRVIELSASPIEDESGLRVGFRGIARDITQRFIARQALKESQRRFRMQYEASRSAERRYRSLLDFLPDPVAVFNMNNTISYLNPAFVNVFGWTLEELEGRRIPFIPSHLMDETREGLRRLRRDKTLCGFVTKRLTRGGEMLDVVLNAAVFFEEQDEPAGQVVILRNVTQERRTARSNQALLRISTALHRYRSLDRILEFIVREVKELISVEGASVILLDEDRKEFYFPVASYDNQDAGQRMREVRFPMDQGVAGEVIRRGEALIVDDTSKSPYFYQQVDDQTRYRTRNMLDAPIRTKDRRIGVLCAVNKKEGRFDETDVEMLTAVANTVALPIENARMNEALQSSYEEVRSLNRLQDRVIHHLSHELKTPVSVLAAALNLLDRRLPRSGDEGVRRTLERAQRNLQRILEIQYGIEDILRDRDYKVYHTLSMLLDACADELEGLAAEEAGEGDLVDRLRARILELFGPRDVPVEQVRLDAFVAERIRETAPLWAHRRVRLVTRLEHTEPVWMAPGPLAKTVDGLIRNAVENTPDGGLIEVTVRPRANGAVFQVRDRGVGITEENRRRLFETIYTTKDTMGYSSKRPYDFHAGGKGFDLLRMKLFSERFHFAIRMDSTRCGHIPADEDLCPGNTDLCRACRGPEDCAESGGTTVTVEFTR